MEVERAISGKGTWEYYLLIIWDWDADIWDEHRDPYVLLPAEREFAQEIKPGKNTRSLIIILPLKRCLAGLRS